MGPLFMLVGGAVAALISLATGKKLDQEWALAAEMMGLQFKPGGISGRPSIWGQRGAVRVQIQAIPAKNNSTTRYTVNHPVAGPPLLLKREGTLSRLTKSFWNRELEIGDPYFDSRVQILADQAHSDQVADFLNPARQAAALRIFGSWRQAEITHRSIDVRSIGIDRGAASIVRTVDELMAIAEILGDPSAVDEALRLQQLGQLGEAIGELHAINEHSSNVFTQMLEAEALMEHGEHEAAAEALPPPPSGPDVDTVEGGFVAELEAWREVASTPAPPLLPTPTNNAAISNLDQQDVIDDLFDGQRMSFQVVQRFEALYLNARVQWSGTVTNVHTYRHDSDFGEGPGLKVSVLLGTAGTSAVISNEVHAVVQLDQGIEIKRDQEITFDGTLLFVDRFARKIYLSSGVVR